MLTDHLQWEWIAVMSLAPWPVGLLLAWVVWRTGQIILGNLAGAVVGGILMGVCEEMVVGYLSSTYRDAFAFGILIVILFFRPAGLLGRASQEKV